MRNEGNDVAVSQTFEEVDTNVDSTAAENRRARKAPAAAKMRCFAVSKRHVGPVYDDRTQSNKWKQLRYFSIDHKWYNLAEANDFLNCTKTEFFWHLWIWSFWCKKYWICGYNTQWYK